MQRRRKAEKENKENIWRREIFVCGGVEQRRRKRRIEKQKRNFELSHLGFGRSLKSYWGLSQTISLFVGMCWSPKSTKIREQIDRSAIHVLVAMRLVFATNALLSCVAVEGRRVMKNKNIKILLNYKRSWDFHTL